jgi:hypothetical protein
MLNTMRVLISAVLLLFGSLSLLTWNNPGYLV